MRQNSWEKAGDGGGGMQLPGCRGASGKYIADTGLVYLRKCFESGF